MTVTDVLWTTDLGSKVRGHVPEFVSLVASSAMWAIGLLIILPKKSGIRLFPERTRLTKWYGFVSLAGLVVFVGWLARDDLSSADAALAAAALYLCLGALFPAIYVLHKWREEDESLELEESANVWVILAIGLAFVFGFTGTILYAADNKATETAAKKSEARLQESERLQTEQSKAIEALETALQAEKEARARMDTTLTTRLDGLAADERQFRESLSAQLKTMDEVLQHLKPSGGPPRNLAKDGRQKERHGPPTRAGHG